MAIGVYPGVVFGYCLREDRSKPEGERTLFKLRPLTALEIASVQDELSVVGEDGEIRMMSGSNLLKILSLGLTGWENLLDGNGSQIEFKNVGISIDNLRFAWWREIADAVLDATHITPELKKN